MKILQTILALTVASLVAVTFTFAGEEPEIKVERHIKLALTDGEEPLVIDAHDLEVGESRQFFTDSGKEVLLSRTDDGLTLEVDGKEMNLGMRHGDHHSSFNMTGGEHGKVIIKQLHGMGEDGEDGEHGEHAFHYVHSDEDFQWVDEGSGDVRVKVGPHHSPLQHLLDSGVLDEVDEATRQKIIDTLKEAEPHGGHMRKMIRIEVDEEAEVEAEEEG